MCEGLIYREANTSYAADGVIERLVSGEWDAANFLIVPPGATIRATLGDAIMDAE